MFIFISSFITGCRFLENIQEKQFKLNKSNSDFVGTWKFVKRLDKYGNKIDTIWHGQAIEIASGPLTTFYSNGTYFQVFTSKNSSTGKWMYDSNEKILTQFLYIDSTTNIGRMLIKEKLAVKH